ncbi:DUF5709 domain-containing protein [Pseudonocardia adelaidensis]|uniref:DUF5709 domain-containing protein n=1 Tax=Pseudonocardia adelaidensis TaxID=648754 RepID=A0ABP9NIA4_9PSEU
MDPENRSDEDDSGVLEPEDSLDDRGVGDVLDEGWSPAEKPWASTGWGTTAREEAGAEPLDARLARELPDGGDWTGDGIGDASDTDGELLDDEVGDARAGRLVSTDGDIDDDFDGDEELYALDAGIDGGAASAEEAAVHVVSEERRLDD